MSVRLLLRWTSRTAVVFLLFDSRVCSDDLFSGLTRVPSGRPDQYSAGCGSGTTAIFHPRLWSFITLPGSNQGGIQMGQGAISLPPTPSVPLWQFWNCPNLFIQLWRVSHICGAQWLVTVRPDVVESGPGLPGPAASPRKPLRA